MPSPSSEQRRENTLNTRIIYQGRLINLRVDTVALPHGGRSEREIVEHPGAVAAVALTAAGEVLLVRQWRQAVAEEILEIPAGTRQPGEGDEECMRRELAEEIGYRPQRLQSLGSIYASPGYSSESIHLFLATELVPATAGADADEFMQVVRVPLDEALAMCADGRIRDGASVAGLLLAARRLAAQR